MLKVTEKNKIIYLHEEGVSNRKIARDLGYDRKTVARIVDKYEEAAAKGELALEDYVSLKPKYTSSPRKKRALTEEICKILDGYINQNENNHAMHIFKQDMDAKQMHKKLVEGGYSISYCSVCNYVKSKTGKDVDREAYIRIHYEPGDIVEFDWGEVWLCLDGVKKKFYMAAFTFAFSNARHGWLFTRQDTLAFQESHVRFFDRVGGSPREIVYDNARTAVKSFVGEKEPTEALTKLELYYHFMHRFCNARRGNEKGHVEKTVEFLRKEAFYNPNFSSFEEAQKHLDEVCAQINREAASDSTLNKEEAVQQDMENLSHNWKGSYRCFEVVSHKVDKYSTIHFRGNHYSVPDNLVGKQVAVKIFSEYIEIRLPEGDVVKHTIVHGCQKYVLDINHYLKTLSRKPGAVKVSEVLHSSPDVIKSLFNNYFVDKPKDFVELMAYIRDNKIELEAIAKVLERLAKDKIRPSLDQIKLAFESPCAEVLEDPDDKDISAQEQMIDDASDETLKAITELICNTNSNKASA